MQKVPATPQRIEYRGTSILSSVNKSRDRVFGHADLFAQTQFKGRLSIGSHRGRRDEVRKKIESLAKAKVDILAAFGSKACH